jgi:CHRD domain
MKSAYFTTLGVIAAVLTVLALATIVFPGLAGPVTADDDDDGGDGLQFEARLTGEEEVTTPPGGVDTQTTGSASFEFNDARTELEFELEVEDGVRVTQAHIHCGSAGENGPVVIFLAGFHDRGWDVDGDWIGDATATDANITNPACGTTLAQIAEAMAQGRTYANVHTIANPAGEVRGQIQSDGDSDNGRDRDEDDD